MIRRKQPGYTYRRPEREPGVVNLARYALWRLGFDPLTTGERLLQAELERDHWRGMYNDLRDKVERSGCDLVA